MWRNKTEKTNSSGLKRCRLKKKKKTTYQHPQRNQKLSNAKSDVLTTALWAQKSSAVLALQAYAPGIRSTGHFSHLSQEFVLCHLNSTSKRGPWSFSQLGKISISGIQPVKSCKDIIVTVNYLLIMLWFQDECHQKHFIYSFHWY